MTIFQSRLKDILIKEASGINIITEERVYIDAISGIFNVPFGYSCTPILDAIKGAYDNFPFHPKEHFYTSEYLDSAKYLLDASNHSDGGILFLNSGSEAVEASISMALQYHRLKGHTHKEKIVARQHSYHGATLGARSVTGRNNFRDLVAEGFKTVRISPPFHTGEDSESGVFGVDEIEQCLLQEDPKTIAAFIFEPVNHLKGMHYSSYDYLQGVRKLCDEFNIVMIADEILSGMYRTTEFLYTHHAEVLPDIIALGKGISSGYCPASAVIAKRSIAECFDGNEQWRHFSHSHTYAGNPISLSAVKASFEHFHDKEIKDHFNGLVVHFNERIERLLGLLGVVRIESRGLLAGVTLSSQYGAKCGKLLEDICFSKGLIIRGEENWITLAPCYNTSLDELNTIFDLLAEAIEQLMDLRSDARSRELSDKLIYVS